jgi:hypothetical protein
MIGMSGAPWWGLSLCRKRHLLPVEAIVVAIMSVLFYYRDVFFLQDIINKTPNKQAIIYYCSESF